MSCAGCEPTASGFLAVGVVVIGRNEAEHLRRSLASLPQSAHATAVYVDSGSTDGSVELAQGRGVAAHSLDPARPFSPARGRREGVELLVAMHPELEFIQFVDGDCELAAGWLEAATAYFAKHSEVAILCGRLEEREPERSVYNWLSAKQWERPAGEIRSSGGIFMIRRDVYQQAGGFNELLVTMEEEDLCNRILAAGHKIVRLDTAMAIHDSGMHSFSQWWQRAIWGGYGAGIQCAQKSDSVTGYLAGATQYLLMPVMVPIAFLLGLVGAIWAKWLLAIPLACLVAYALLFARMARSRLRIGNQLHEALVYSFFIILRRFPVAIGLLRHLLKRSSKRPDPHCSLSH